MPRIPLYEPNQISPIGIQTPRATNLPAGAFGEQIGKGLLDIGVVANKMQDEADTLRAEEAYNNWIKNRDEIAYGKDGAFNIKGAGVFNRPDGQSFVGEFTGKAQTAAQDIATGLANDNQRAKFNRLAGTAIRSFGTSLSQYELKEGETWRKSVYEGVVNTETENIAKNFENPDERQMSIDRVRENTRLFASSQGLSGEQLDITVKEAVSKMHGVVIARLLENNNGTAAKEYYDANKDAITAKDGAVMRKAIKADNDNTEAQNAVDAVWKGFGPQEDDEAVNLDSMAATIRDQYKDKPEVQKLALAMLKERASEFDYSVRQRQSQQVGGIWKRVIAGDNLTAIRSMPEFKALDGAKQASMLTSIQSFRDGAGNGMAQFKSYWEIASNPEKLAAMSDDQIFALAPTLGDTLTKNLLKAKADLNNPAKIAEARIDTDDFNYVAQGAGLKPFDSKKSENEKAALGSLKFAVEQRINVEQQRLKRALSRDEKMAVMQAEIDNKVMVDKWGRDKQVPVSTLTKDEMGNAYVVVNGQEVKINAIPAESRAKIIRQMRANGIPVTEQGIAAAWVAARNRPSSRVEQISQ